VEQLQPYKEEVMTRWWRWQRLTAVANTPHSEQVRIGSGLGFKIESFETSFNSKQLELEPKLVSALSETKCLFWLFQFYTKTESFGVSIIPKQTKEQLKQFCRDICIFSENLGLLWFVSKQRVSIF
jgi:hypothetical protein